MINMSELSAVFESLSFSNVKTYINSGNIAFDSAKTTEKRLVASIENAIEETFGKKIAVMVRGQRDIDRVLANNPFDGEFENHKEMHVLFMRCAMSAEKANQLLEVQTADERFAVVGREIYCHLKLGVAGSLLGKGFIDKKLKVSVTARNWRTVQKLAQL